MPESVTAHHALFYAIIIYLSPVLCLAACIRHTTTFWLQLYMLREKSMWLLDYLSYMFALSTLDPEQMYRVCKMCIIPSRKCDWLNESSLRMTRQWPPILNCLLTTCQAPVTTPITLGTYYTHSMHALSLKSTCTGELMWEWHGIHSRCNSDNHSKVTITIPFFPCSASRNGT